MQSINRIMQSINRKDKLGYDIQTNNSTGCVFADRIVEFGRKAEEKGLFVQDDQYDWGHIFRGLDRYVITYNLVSEIGTKGLIKEDDPSVNPGVVLNPMIDQCWQTAYDISGLEKDLAIVDYRENNEPNNQAYDRKVGKLHLLLSIYQEVMKDNNLSSASEMKFVQEKINSRTPIPGAPRSCCQCLCMILMIVIAIIGAGIIAINDKKHAY